MSPSVRMWVNRFDRICGAWNDPENPRARREPAITCVRAYLGAAIACFLYVIWYCWFHEKTGFPNPLFDLVTAIAVTISFTATAFLACKKSAVYHGTEQDRFGSFFLSSILLSFACSFVVLISNQNYGFRPATLELYKSAVAADPSCDRYEDYVLDRKRRGNVLTIHDLDRARDECESNREMNRILEDQNRILEYQKSTK